MTKSEMIDQLASAHDVSKATANRILASVIELIHTDLRKTGRCAIPSLGTFTVTKRAARTGRNPATGTAIKIKASKSARFKPAPALKESIAKFKG